MITDHLSFNREIPFPKYKIEFRRIRPIKQTRTIHFCGICRSIIPQGSTTLYFSGLTIEVGFYHYHSCQHCIAGSERNEANVTRSKSKVTS